MKVYRQLRQEGLKFPPRDPNERFMINFEGEPSPALEMADMEQRVPIEEERLTEYDLDILKVNLPQLEEILANATDATVIQHPNYKEIVKKCRQGQKKLVAYVTGRTGLASDQDTADMLEVMDYVNAKMEAFKSAAKMLRNGVTGNNIRRELRVANASDGSDVSPVANWISSSTTSGAKKR